MTAPATQLDAPANFWSSVAFGTLCGLVASVGYTGANMCLRAVAHCDPVWVSAVKSVPTVVLMLPFLAWAKLQGRRALPDGRSIVALGAAGLLGQLAGNVFFQWSLGVVGLALAVPLCLGGQIISSGVLGRMFLNEPVTWRRAVGIAVLITATAVLSSGAADAHRTVAHPSAANGAANEAGNWLELVGGVLAATLSGFAYALLGVVIRRCVTRETSIPATLFIVCVVGTISLGAWTPAKIGWQAMVDTRSIDLYFMLGAGLFNAGAFFALTKSLQLTPVVYVNALNATQASMAAVAGVLCFSEAPSAGLALGVLLTVVGLFFMRGGKS